MDMSVNPDSMAEVDYSDFDYQLAKARIQAEEADDSTGGGNVFIRTVFDVPVLDGVGGLDNNEVAELVYLETQARIRYNDASGDQNVASTGRVAGAVGANLPSSTDAFPQARSGGTEGEFVSTQDISQDNTTLTGTGGTEDRWFQQFEAQGSTPFDDQTNGPGGAGGFQDFQAEKNWRNLTGRGPVLDSSDNMSIALELSVDDTILDANGICSVHMVWDVAETSDAGRAFSVPMDD